MRSGHGHGGGGGCQISGSFSPISAESETLMCLAQPQPPATAVFQSKRARERGVARQLVQPARGLAPWGWVQSSRKGEAPESMWVHGWGKDGEPGALSNHAGNWLAA